MTPLSLALLFCGDAASQLPSAAAPAQVSRDLGDGLVIHALRTGWVQVKAPHRESSGRGPVLLQILSTRQWAEWMPVISYVVEHPEGLIVVDTGPGLELQERLKEADRINRNFYANNLRFHVAEGEGLSQGCAALGLDCAQAAHLVITHFHADHIGEMEVVPQARVWTGPGNWPQHVGATPVLVPQGMAPETARFGTEGTLAERGQALTADGRVRIVHLPGHTPGHVGLWIAGTEETWLAVGDATFDMDQTRRGAVSGVSDSVHQAQETQALLRGLLEEGVGLLPSHDPSVFERLLSGP